MIIWHVNRHGTWSVHGETTCRLRLNYVGLESQNTENIPGFASLDLECTLNALGVKDLVLSFILLKNDGTFGSHGASRQKH